MLIVIDIFMHFEEVAIAMNLTFDYGTYVCSVVFKRYVAHFGDRPTKSQS